MTEICLDLDYLIFNEVIAIRNTFLNEFVADTFNLKQLIKAD